MTSLAVRAYTNQSDIIAQQDFNEVNLTKHSKYEAKIIELFSMLASLVTGGECPRVKFWKVKEDDGKISYVARHNIVSIGYADDARFQYHKGNEQVQDKVLQILDPFENGFIEAERLEKFLGTRTIDWSDTPVYGLEKVDEDLEMVLAKLEQIHIKNLQEVRHEVPLCWKDYVAMEDEEKGKFATMFIGTYGDHAHTQLKSHSSVNDVPENLAVELNEIYDTELAELEKRLETGDIIFFKLDPTKYSKRSLINEDEFIDYGILRGQKTARNWIRGPKENESHSFIHVGLIVKDKDGKVMIAEATPGDSGDDVRLINIRDPEARLRPSSKQEFRIVRAKNEQARNNYAKIAASIAQIVEHNEDYEVTKVMDAKSRTTIVTENGKSTSETNLKYTKTWACASLFRNSSFDKKTKRNIFLTYAQLHRKDRSLEYRDKKREFFCSYFVSFCMGYGEAIDIIRDIIGTDTPDFNSMSKKEMKQWAKKMEKEHGNKLNAISLTVNPKNISPQRLRKFFHENPDKFSDVLSIVKPRLYQS